MSDSLSEKNIDDEFFTALRWHCSSVFFRRSTIENTNGGKLSG